MRKSPLGILHIYDIKKEELLQVEFYDEKLLRCVFEKTQSVVNNNDVEGNKQILKMVKGNPKAKVTKIK